MDQNYFPHHHFAHPHHPHSQQYQQQQQQFACGSQEFYIPPPQTGASSHPVVCDATFAEAQQQHQAFIDSSQLDPFANADEGGPIGWVPPEERGFQHQPASNAIGTSNEVSVAYPTVDQQQQQPQFAPPTFQQSSTSNWSGQPQPAANLGIYQMAGEAVAFHNHHHAAHHHHAHQVQVPQDMSSDGIPGQPQSTAPGITNVPHQAPISMLAPQAVYPSTLLDPASTSPSVPFQQQQQHGTAVRGGTQGYPQPAVAQGYNADVQVQHEPHSHEGNNLSHPVYSTSSAAPSTGVQFAPVTNPGVAPSSSSSASSSESLYPAGVYQQPACGSSESMAILNGAIPHHQQQAQIPHQQQLYSASGSYEAQSQYLAHHPQPSTRAQTFHSGLSDPNAASNFITSPTASSTTSSSNSTHGVAVCVQQPQPLAPSRTSSLAAWADVPPTPIVNPEHGPVPGLAHGVQDYHYQYHHQTDVVKEEQGVQFQQQQQQAYSPVQQHQPHQLKIEDVKPQLHQAYGGAPEHTIKPVSPQVLTQVPHHPGMSRASTDVAVPRAQPQSLSRSATMPDMSASAAAAQQRANGPANGNTAALAPTRSVAEFDVAPRPVEAIKASETVRQAAKLHIDVGQADPNSPTSHEARLKARSLRRKGSAAPPQHGYSPYQREYAARRGSSASQHDEHAAHQHAHAQQQPIVPSSRPTTALPTDQYGAQRTFIFNPYQDPSTLPVETGKQGHIPHGVPLPTPSVTAVVTGAPAATAQHQTIEFSGSAESMSPEDLGKGKALDRSAADAAALMMGEKKPFLACGFCRQRKIACGQRAPHPRDNEIGEGPRTCNQCARRHILCSFPSESRRGLRKTKPVTKTIIQEDGTEVTIVVEDEEEIEEIEQASSKKSSKSKKKGRGPMEWIIAADAWLITPTAWAAHKAALEKKAAEGNGSMPGSSGAQSYQTAAFDDAPLSAGPSASAVHV
ncbi:hypothetical protein FS837_002702 [Tulasnella sp. UAMH 9824]|nr:hypothetical protein FS837_002702 [Tulasnella sp. UAMH 9824]